MKQRNTVVAKLWLCGLMLTAAGCGRGHTLFGNLLLNPPVITDTLPATVTGATLQVHGSRDPSTAVYIVYGAGNAKGTLLADSAASNTWTATIDLQQGDNSFYLYEATTALQSNNSPTYNLGRVPLPPGVTAPQSVSAAAGTAQVTGTKESGTSIKVTDQGNVTTTYVPTDNTTNWTAQVAVVNGNNVFNFEASNGKYSSTPVPVTIFGSPLLPPIFTYKSPTNQPSQTIQGQRPLAADQGAPLWIVIDNGTPVLVPTGTQTPQWNYGITLTGDGNHTVTTYEIDPNTNIAGPSFTAIIVLKTTVPSQPTISSPAQPFADVGNANFLITGSTDSGSFLCVSQTSQGTCVVTGPSTGGSFSVTNTLQPGSNTLYISARDTAGNISTEIVGTVYLDSPPVVSNPTPADGSVVVGLSIPTSVTVVPAAADAGRSSAAITSVTVSLDGGSPVADTNNSGTWSSTVTLPNGTATGSQHTIVTVATDGAGATTTYISHIVYSDGSASSVSNDNTGYDDQVPSSAMDANGRLFVMWQSNCGSAGTSCPYPYASAPDIFFRVRSQNGNWSSIGLASSSTGDQDSKSPAVALDPNSGKIHVLWSESGSIAGKQVGSINSHGIVHRIYTPSTGTWSSVLPLSSSTSTLDDQAPAIAIDANGLVHAAWSRYNSTAGHSDIFYARYTAGAWTTELQVTPASGSGSDPGQGLTQFPTIGAAASGRAQIAWQQCEITPTNTCTGGSAQNRDIYLREVTTATTLGFGPVLVSDKSKASGADGDSTFPSMFIDSTNTAWIFWIDGSNLAGTNGLAFNVWYRNYQAGSATTAQYNLVTGTANTNGPASGPIIATQGPATAGAAPFAVAWSQFDSNNDNNVWARTGNTSNQTSLNTPVYHVSTSPILAIQPAMALDPNGNLYVSWSDYPTSASSALQVYFQPVPVQ